MKVWAILEEHMTHNGHLQTAMKSGSGNGALLDNQTEEALRKLKYAVKLNGSLKSLEQERNQVYTQLCDVERASENLTEHIKNVQCKQEILWSENTQLEVENKKLWQNIKEIKELYEEIGMKFYKKFVAEDHYQ
jgi:chromosome segregation ATPase